MMRNYGVQSKCFMLKMSEFTNLMKENKDTIKDFDFENDDLEDYCIVDDFVNMIDYACWFGEISGSFYQENAKEEYQYFDDEDIMIIELTKDTLFDKYNDYNEVYDEIRTDLESVGIIVDNNYVKEHFGLLSGSYYA
jgi:hypothetical protein